MIYLMTWPTGKVELYKQQIRFTALRFFNLVWTDKLDTKKLEREGQLVQENPEAITYLFIDKNLETLKSLTSGKIYNSLIKDRISEPTPQRYFERKFNKTETDWSQIYLLPRKVSVETRTRVFQFKILHNILYLNQRLHKMGLAESPLCNLCGICEETTTHLFLNCPITTNLWRTIQKKCSPSLTLPDITVSTVHLGFFVRAISPKYDD